MFIVSLYADTIKKIEYKNLAFISKESIEDLTSIKAGDELDEKLLNIAIKKLYKQEYFDDIEVDFEDGILIYVFKEKPSLSKIDIKGYKNNQDEIDDFLKTLGIKKGDMYDSNRVQKLVKKFEKHLENDGKIDSIVETEIVKTGDSSIELTFVVNQGESLTITKQNIFGNKSLKKSEIDKILVNKERNPIWGWMWGFNNGDVKLEQLKYDSLRLKDLYMQKGYLDAVVTTPLLSVDFNDYSATMDLKVVEGKQFSVKNINIEYIDKEVISIDKLLKELKLQTKKPFNVTHLRADLSKIKTKVAALGYAFAKVIPDIQKDVQNSSVDVTYRIKSGNLVHINDVIISGNSSTIDRVIRRAIFLAPGDTYSLSEIKESKNALSRTGYFEGVGHLPLLFTFLT